MAVRVATAVALSLPDAPLRLELRGVGVRMPFGLGVPPAGAPAVPGAPGLPDVAGQTGALGLHLPVDGIDPTGAGVAFDSPVVAASGRIERRPSGDYAGILAARVPPVSATAFGVLGLARPASFAVVLSATFPPPGVQVGLGFSLTGVGGVVAVNRRVDRAALLQAVADGTAARLLFPRDLGAGAGQVLASLEAIFPRAPGRVIAGPMFQLSWGGRLVTASFAVLLELPEPVRLSLLGTLLVTVPDPELPLVRIEATFAGTFDPQVPSFELFASVRGSIVGVTLTGDLYALVRGGATPTLVLSAGGFHPRYPVPAGVPPIRRLGMVLAPTPLIELRCQAYVAVTSNTIQFGARLELSATVAGCGLSGHLAFDVLVQRDPTHFVADASAAIAVRVFGEKLAGVSLDFTLEGPAPWRARGRGSVELFLLSASFDFDETWGDPPPQRTLPPPNVGGRLLDALRDRGSWVARAPDLTGAPFVLADGAARRLAAGELLHPQGALGVRQRAVPLRLRIDRFDGVPVAPQTWDVADPPGGALGDAGELREEFAAGQFQALDDDRALSRPSFEAYRAGVRFTAGGVETAPDARAASLAFETTVITGDEPAVRHRDLDVGDLLDAALAVAAAPGIDQPVWWRPATDPVTVAAPPVVLVDGLSLAAAQDAPPFPTAAEAEQAAAALRAGDPRRRVAVADAWEAQG
ncbi:MAG TPA: DUF6603 domain-containing protein [Solirubrobacteraceae bacterium]|nr:DUF6603 domain-containing protein [Solirubrobacteraceae bacterium]